MDQDAFRNLLSVPRSAGPSARSASLLGTGVKKADTAPAFQPRKVVKKKDDDPSSGYRNRAAERRQGTNNEFAEVEAVLDTFEKKTSTMTDRDEIERERQFLGGDAKHTVLVKGLDFALLEQNKARQSQVQEVEDDDLLENAFAEGSTSAEPKKKTREELLQNLKATRSEAAVTTAPQAGDAMQKAKAAGKFKPIGAPEESKKSKGKKRATEDGAGEVRKKKKKKVDNSMPPPSSAIASEVDSRVAEPAPPPLDAAPAPAPVTEPATSLPEKPQSPLPTSRPSAQIPMDEDDDFDIFAGVGEYDGYDFDEDDQARPTSSSRAKDPPTTTSQANKDWFKTKDSESPPPAQRPPTPPPPGAPSVTTKPTEEGELNEDEDGDQQMKLQPLTSSSVPSVQDLLAMDDAVATADKKRARKEKNKKKGGGGGGGADGAAKLERDLKKLSSYMGKKGAGQ